MPFNSQIQLTVQIAYGVDSCILSQRSIACESILALATAYRRRH